MLSVRASILLSVAVLGCEGRLTLGDAPAGTDATTGDSVVVLDTTGGGDTSAPTDSALRDEGLIDGSNPNGCSVDVACKLSTLHCDDRSGSCVPCLNDAHCPKAVRRCDQALHRCVECGVDLDCRADEMCEPISRRCVRTCGDGGTCPADAPRCDATRGFCIRCTADTDCDKKRCDLSSGTCVDCLADLGCPKDRPRCDTIPGRCVQCLASDDCPTTKPLCDPTIAACTAK